MYKKFIEIDNCDYTNNKAKKFSYTPPNICPKCKNGIEPVALYSISYEKDDIEYVTLLQFCPVCLSAFICTYRSEISGWGSDMTKVAKDMTELGPSKFVGISFDETITLLSPTFVKIYNQALEADARGLDEIAGIGYRKALEFLIKDFAIHINQDKADEILTSNLNTCINKYIDSEHIKILASRSVWIGNDEAHYIRRQRDYDISDMKRFIKSLVSFIESILVAEEASLMSPVTNHH